MRRVAGGRERRELAAEAPVVRRTAPRADSSHPRLEQPRGARDWCAASVSGTWCARNVPSIGCPSTTFGPVQPLGVASTIIGQRGRVDACRSCAPLTGCRGCRATTRSSVSGHQRVHDVPGRRLRRSAGPSRSRAAAARAPRAGCAPAPSGSRSCSRSGAGSAAPRRRSTGIEKLVRVPGGRQRTGLGFTVADDAGGDQIGIVEDRAERVAQRVAELAAFVDAAGRFRRDVARDAAGKRKLPEQRSRARPRPA